MLVVKYALLWLIPAVVLSALQLTLIGRISALVLGLDAIAGTVLPFGLLSLALAFTEPASQSDPEEGDGGGGEPREDPGPSAPHGGLSFDWETFEADFRAYAQENELVASVRD